MPRYYTVFLGLLSLALPQVVLAAEAKTPVIDRVRAFLIYEDTGDLSKNVAKTADQIVANDEKGSGVQILIDVILTAKKDQLFENNPMLHVLARSIMDGADAPPILDKTFPLNYVGSTGELIRTVVVDHNCNGFELEAYVMDGKKKTSELKKSFSITCGD